jgi:hypothetical protein
VIGDAYPMRHRQLSVRTAVIDPIRRSSVTAWSHADVATTFQVYTHRSIGHDREAAERIGELNHRTVAGSNVSLPDWVVST